MKVSKLRNVSKDMCTVRFRVGRFVAARWELQSKMRGAFIGWRKYKGTDALYSILLDFGTPMMLQRPSSPKRVSSAEVRSGGRYRKDRGGFGGCTRRQRLMKKSRNSTAATVPAIPSIVQDRRAERRRVYRRIRSPIRLEGRVVGNRGSI